MTKDERDELRKLCDAATPGPWEDHRGTNGIAQHWSREPPWEPVIEMVGNDSWAGCTHALVYTDADGAFIVAARTALPALLDEIKQLESQLSSAKTLLALIQDN